MTEPLFALVHAPVLGPACWLPVARELAANGHRVVVPDLTGFEAAGPPYAPRLTAVAVQLIGASPADRVVLVPHSGAGPFAAQIARDLRAVNCTVVFADAGLPGADGGGAVVEPAFLPYLAALAADGAVPPWPLWWPDEDLTPLFPDSLTRADVTSQARPIPLAFFAETLPPVPTAWPPKLAAYLLFSESYADVAEAARTRGWPVEELPGEHMHMLIDPVAVAAAIVRLAALSG